ncbi:MAG TPA: NADPH-dependent glutamate synthase, partial [Candidatus Polarisedimenticolia bacterium]|nr:NADPH-dependent glutamate synthase [Candidatus Polarisedimenticolia bacterium]
FLWDVEAPRVARAARPGHFLMVRIDEAGERIPLTVADFDTRRGTVTVVVQAVGKTTRQMMALPEGAGILDFVGTLGVASEIERAGTVVLVGGGLGVAPVFPQLRAHKEAGNRTITIIGFRSRDLIFWQDRFARFSDELIVTTDDGSYGRKGFVTGALEEVLAAQPDVSLVIAIGPLVMMKACAHVTRPRGIRTLVSLNSIMVDGTGMCGSCRVTVGKETKFACVDGPDFEGHAVDFDELMLRQKRFEREEREALERYTREADLLAGVGPGRPDPMVAPRRARAGARPEPPAPLPPAPERGRPIRTIRTVAPVRTPMPVRDAAERRLTFDEVALGYSLDLAIAEADRCLQCRKPACVPGCPVGIDIPGFIAALSRRDVKASYRILKGSNMLPAVCGRVCPQESQCEATCVVGRKLQPVAIGRLERFVADCAAGRDWEEGPAVAPTGRKAAVIGSGPAGLACAGDLARAGVDVSIFEALHVAGGVLKYGIPEFRLPNDIIDIEVEGLRRLGVKIELDTVIGKVLTIPDLMNGMGYGAVFIATGAGSPRFLGIPGESFNGVFSANEFLTRVNLMQGHRRPLYDTPVGMGRRVVVVGAGNTAMDSARVALRMGAESVTVVYRRSRAECPARVEELQHAIEEGVEFRWLTNPVTILGTPGGWVRGMTCQRMELGEPDISGRRRPVPAPGTGFDVDVDTVIYALGTRSNPIISQTTPGLGTNKFGYILIDEQTGATSVPGVFAGGDIVTGSATVILAMGAGRRAAKAMLQHLGLAEQRAGELVSV